MGTLSGNTIKTTYQGLLKTSDSAALTSSLKVIEDGEGNDSALSLSTAAVKVESLQINTPVFSGSSDVLVWDSTAKSVGFRTLPAFDAVTATVTGTSNPILTIADTAGSSSTVTFNSGTNIQVSNSSGTITFDNSTQTVNNITTGVTLTAADSDKTHFIDANTLSGGTIVLPTAAAGLYFKFVIVDASSTAFKITTNNAAGSGTVQRFIGKVVVNSTTDDQVAVQKVINTGNTFDNDTLSIDGDAATSGGNEGDVIHLHCATISSVATWVVDARLTTTNANPSSIAVIGAS